MPRDALRALIRDKAEQVAEEIVVEWRRIGDSEVWLSLPNAMDFDHLPAVLRSLAGAAFAPRMEEPLCHDLTRQAARHGEDRLRQGFEEHHLYAEYHLLRRSMWHLFQRHVEPSVAAAAILRVDALISLATMASLQGYHRPAFEERDEWPEALERLVAEWPLTGQG